MRAIRSLSPALADGPVLGAARPAVTSALVGASSVRQLEENLAAVDKTEFTDKELSTIDGHAVEVGINIWKASSDQ